MCAGGLRWRRRELAASVGTAALVFSGLLLVRLAYVGCGGLCRAVGEKHTMHEMPR